MERGGMMDREALTGKVVTFKIDNINVKGTIVNVRYKKRTELWVDVPEREHLAVITTEDVIRYEVL
jgi:hypothetical protein